MNFINFWQREIALGAGVTSAALDLPNGTYTLVISDAVGTAATVWEVVKAVVASGAATLTRGQEGTTDATWPAGSVVYCALTAGQFAGLAAQLAALTARVAALEAAGVPENSVLVTAGELPFEGGAYQLGWFPPDVTVDDFLGSIAPASLNIPGVGSVEVVDLSIVADPDPMWFQFALRGNPGTSGIVSIDVEGIGTLLMSAAAVDWQSVFNRTLISWDITAHDWVDGGQRLVTVNFA